MWYIDNVIHKKSIIKFIAQEGLTQFQSKEEFTKFKRKKTEPFK